MLVIIMLDFSIDFKSDNDKLESQKLNEVKPNLTSIYIDTNSTNVLQNQLISSTNVQSISAINIESAEMLDVNRGSIERIPMDLPENITGEFKTYMDFRCITDESSDQYKLQQQAYTDENGFRKIDNKFIVALGTGYAQTIGDEFHIVLDSGIEFDVIVGDIKNPKHTDDTNRYIEKNGNICEFIVDTNKLSELSLTMGDVSYAGFNGSITSIERVVK